jgi:hypothetical protein
MFASFAVTGLFVSLVPSFIGRDLHNRDHAAAGVVALTFFAVATPGQLVLHRVLSRNAIPLGCACCREGLRC